MTIDISERLDRESLDIADDRVAKLREDFPEAFRDGKVDFDTLKRALGEWVEPESERFGLTWPGKAAAFQAVQQPSVATLLPDPDNSVDWDTTQNLIIEGDNLEVLKLLQRSCYGKVKMIYIDPPYNTGNDFIYPDNYREGLQSYLEFTGQVNSEGKKLTTNTESDGRYHSNWLNMMYPRLYLARNLLRDDGVIFVSIDDHEVANLRAIMNEVFGEEQFVVQILWKKRSTPPNDQIIGANHDYIVCYSKDSNSERLFLRERTDEQTQRYRNPDNHPKGPWAPGDLMANVKGGRFVPSLHFAIRNPRTGQEHYPSNNGNWRFSRERIEKLIAADEISFGESGNGRPKLKRFLADVKAGVTYSSIWDFVPLNTVGSSEMQRIFGDPTAFESPKPSGLISELTHLGSGPHDIVLDFFAGSGTTAHAVMQQNAEDGGNRRYILVQLPEPIDLPKTLDDGTTLSTIADITRERVRRAGAKIAGERVGVDPVSTPTNGDTALVDVGFRSYRLATSNFKPWDGTSPDPKQSRMDLDLPLPEPDPNRQIAMQLEAFTDNVLSGRSSEDILTEIILRLGYELTVPVESLDLFGHRVYAIDNGAVLACLDTSLSLALFEEMVARDPGQIVCLDSAFGDDDELKVNASQIIRSRARSEESSITFWLA